MDEISQLTETQHHFLKKGISFKVWDGGYIGETELAAFVLVAPLQPRPCFFSDGKTIIPIALACL